MNTISQSIIESLGATLLHSLWQGLVIVLILSFLLKVLKNKSPQFKYHLSCVSLLGLVTWMSSTFFGHFNANINQHSDAGIPIYSEPAELLAGDFMETLNWQQNLETYFSSFIELYSSELVFIWLLGVLLFGIKWTGAFYYTFSLKNNNTAIVPLEWQNKIKQLSYKLGIHKKINILESAKVDVPMVIGYLKPVILIPTSAFTGFTADQLEAVIVHELAHIKNNDFLINMVLSALEVVLFYHPAYWFIYKIIMQERENHCDDIAVAHIGNPRLYAETLFNMEKIRQQHSLAMALQGNKNQLLERIKRICIAPNQQYKGGINKSGMAMGFLFILAIIALAKVPLDAKETILIPLKEEIKEAFIPPVKTLELNEEKDILLTQKNNHNSFSDEITIIGLSEENNNPIYYPEYPTANEMVSSIPLKSTLSVSPKKEYIQLESFNPAIYKPVFQDSIPGENGITLTIVSTLDNKGNTTLTYYKKGKVTKRIFIEKNKAKYRLNGITQEKGNRTYKLRKEDTFTIKGTMEISDDKVSLINNGIMYTEGDENDENNHSIFHHNSDAVTVVSKTASNVKVIEDPKGYYTIEERDENGELLSTKNFNSSSEAMKAYELENEAAHERNEAAHERNEAARERNEAAHERNEAARERSMKAHERNMKKHEENMKKHEKDHEKNMKRHEEEMEEHDKRMEEHGRNMKQHDRNMKRHDQQMERMEEFQTILIQELLKDGLIKNKKKVDFSLSKGKMKIRGKRVADKYHAKYLKLYEKFSGSKMNEDSTYRYQLSK